MCILRLKRNTLYISFRVQKSGTNVSEVVSDKQKKWLESFLF